jgi:hypothetical protein
VLGWKEAQFDVTIDHLLHGPHARLDAELLSDVLLDNDLPLRADLSCHSQRLPAVNYGAV